MIEDEDLLMAVLNSAPVSDGRAREGLAGPGGSALAQRFDGSGSVAELTALRGARDAIHRLVRGEQEGVAELGALLASAHLRPEVTPDGVRWVLSAPPESRLAARTALAWSRAAEQMPGRLRPCANTECNLFLLDHSRPGTARWCSMATCGNRSKARAHARRARSSGAAH